jgi:hypothetical protein
MRLNYFGEIVSIEDSFVQFGHIHLHKIPERVNQRNVIIWAEYLYRKCGNSDANCNPIHLIDRLQSRLGPQLIRRLIKVYT